MTSQIHVLQRDIHTVWLKHERERDFHFKPKKFSDVINLIRVISLFLYSFDIHFNEFSYLTHHDLTFSQIIYKKKKIMVS